jgi:hypothetical protein
MKLIYRLILLFFCILSVNAAGQCDSLWHQFNPDPGMHEIGRWSFEEMPSFPGGEDARTVFFKENMKFPPYWPADSVSGKVFTTFIVDEKGNIKCPRILRGLNPTLDSVALAVIAKMPTWRPAKVRGIAVSSPFNLPVIFGTVPKMKKH